MSTTIGGIRIVDMPDLGGVDDTSSMVGERAGSGRFAATALRSYVSSYIASGLPWIAMRPSGGDDLATLQAAINGVAPRGGVVMLGPGVYNLSATLVLPSFVTLHGAGVGVTIIRAAGPNFDLIQTTGYASLIGTGSNAGTYQNAVFAMTLDGNKALGGAAGNCLSIYGYDYRVDDVECCNAAGTGFRSEWGLSSAVPVAAGGNSMEAHILRLKTFNCGADGLLFLGPHDSYLTDITSFINNGRGIVLGGTTGVNGAEGAQLTNGHSYGNQQVGIQVDVQVNMQTVQGENNRSSGGIAVTANGSIIGSNVIAYENTGYGISFAGNGSIISGLFSYDNSGDGVDIAGWQNLLTTVSSTHNLGAGLIIGNASLQNNVSGIVVSSNGGVGISVASRDNRITGIYSIFNVGGGVGVADGMSGMRLEGELNNNGTSWQLAFNTSGGGNIFDFYIFTEAGQTAWTGVTSSYDFMQIVTAGASMMPVNIVPRTNPQPGSVGEYVAAQVPFGSPLAATSGVPLNITSITLQPGEWDVSGTVAFTYTTVGAGSAAWVGVSSATQPPPGSLGFTAVGTSLGNDSQLSTGTARMSLATPTVVYLSATSGFGSGTAGVFGTIQARRVL